MLSVSYHTFPECRPFLTDRDYYVAPALLFAFFGPAIFLLGNPRESKESPSRLLWWLKLTSSICLAFLQALLAATSANVTISDEIYLIVLCMPSIAACTLAHDAYHRNRPPALLDTYLFLVLIANTARTWDHWEIKDDPLVSVWSGLAAVAGAACAVWNWVERAAQSLPGLTANVTARLQKNRHFERSPLDKLSMFLFFGFLELRDKSDLPDFGPAVSSQKLADRFYALWATANKTSQNALLQTIARTVIWPLLGTIPPRLFYVACQLYNILLMKRVIAFVAAKEAAVDDSAWAILRGMIASSLVLSIAGVWSQYMKDEFDGLVHGLLSSITWKKTFSLTSVDAQRIEISGNYKNEIQRISNRLRDFHGVWFAPVEISLGLYFFYACDGSISLSMIPPLIVAAFIRHLLNRHSIAAATSHQHHSKQLVLQTSQITSIASTLKMFGLEQEMEGYLRPFQEAEVASNYNRNAFNLLTWMSFVWVTDIPALSVIATGAVWNGHIVQMEAASVFDILAFTTMIIEPSTILMRDTPYLKDISSSCSSIQSFLLSEGVQDRRLAIEPLSPQHRQNGVPSSKLFDARAADINAVKFRSVTLPAGQGEIPLIRDINLFVRKGQRVALTGPVGSGKSTLLRSITGEVAALRGTISLLQPFSCIGYCSQSPWLQNTTIRDNITNRGRFDPDWYKEIIHSCGLERDIEDLPGSDLFVVGVNGANLSGGQRLRLALARAIYLSPPIIIVDDIVSGLDKRTATLIFSTVFGPRGLLTKRGITTIVVTNTVQLISHFDQVIFLDKHHALEVARGTLEIKKALDTKIRSGELSASVQDSDEENNGDDDDPVFFGYLLDDGSDVPVRKATKPSSGKTDAALYFYLVRSVPRVTLLLCIVLASMHALMERGPTFFLREWLDWAPDNMSLFWVYVAVVALRPLITGLEAWIYHLTVSPQCSITLHQELLGTILRAPFAVLGTIDHELFIRQILSDGFHISAHGDMVLKGTVYAFTFVSMDATLILHGIPILVFIFPVLIASLYLVRSFHSQAAEQLRVMEEDVTNRIQKNTKEVSHGLEHFRCMGLSKQYMDKGFELLDGLQQISYAMLHLRSWLTVYIHLVMSAMMISATLAAIFMRDYISPAGVGIAFFLGQCSSTELQNFFQYCSSLEGSILEMARLRAFMTGTPPEVDLATEEVEPDWPQRGDISFEAVSATYESAEMSHTALHEVTLDVKSGQKVGIIGRTGSGKSTLLLTLLNLLSYQGSVTIDGIEISAIPKRQLRSRITTIPQYPVKLPGTIRDNILPWDLPNAEKSVPDNEILSILSDLGAKDYIEAHGGLDAEAVDVELPHGQKQIVAMTRAILHQRVHKTKIVLMDEVTSALEDGAGQRALVVLHQAFKDCTTFIVTHKTQTLQEVNLVAEFASGQLVFQVAR